MGIYFSYDEDEAQRRNFDSRYAEMNNTLSKWKKRGLTLIGKIQNLKTYVMSKIIYLLSNISLPIKFIKDVEKLMFSFLWNGPDKKISSNNVCRLYAEGGVKFPNIQSMVDTQLVKWTLKYFCSPDQKWKIFLDHLVTKFGGKTLFVSNYTIELLIKMEDIPMFYILIY